MVGELNAVNPLITIFFMITYAMINYACFQLAISNSPGWRPSFKWFSSQTALAGTVVCLAVMILINPYYALGASFFAGSLIGYISYLDPQVNWGSAMDARRHMKAMERVQALNRVKSHVKNFRPGFLVMLKDEVKEDHLIKYVRTMEHAYGTDVFVNVIEGKLSRNK